MSNTELEQAAGPSVEQLKLNLEDAIEALEAAVTAVLDSPDADAILEDEAEAWTDWLQASLTEVEASSPVDWVAYYDRDTLAVSFKASYELEDSDGVLKVVFQEESDSWFFHDTRYNEQDEVSHFESNFSFSSPGEALQKAEQWLANQ